MKNISLIAIVVFYSTLSIAQNQVRYSQILIDIDRPNIVQYLIENGLEIDHSHKHGDQLEVVVSEQDLSILSGLDLGYSIEVHDLAKSYEKLVSDLDPNQKMDCGLENFDTGSMGLYHSYSDMQDHIFNMQLQFPELVRVSTIGTSVQGRDIYAVKISDNVGINESGSEAVVYYDAITHAREPMGLETILFYMWSLLENYGTDETLTYIVDNRELYFVPVVNPDGYVYNQTTNPNGGGLWRKNRRVNGDGSFGIDLNRNYGDGWGLDIGSSSIPSSNTYRGPTAFSEPESRAIRDFTQAISPTAAFSNHTYSDVLLCPFGYSDEQPDHDIYSELAIDMIPQDYQGFGNWQQMIFYYGSGSAHDYLHSQGTIAMTPEIGHSFWENPNQICDRVSEMFPSMLYLSWIAGSRTVYQNHRLNDESVIWEGNECDLEIRFKNKGLKSVNHTVTATLSTTDPRIEIPSPSFELINLEARMSSPYIPFTFNVNGLVLPSEPIVFTLTVEQDGVVTSTDEMTLAAGVEEVLFSESAENGLINWQSSGGTGFAWDVTEDGAFDGMQSITDSPLGNHESGINTQLVMTNPIDLSGMEMPWLEFSAQWSLEPNIDYAELKLSDDGGNTWFLLSGNYTNGSGKYTGHQSWVRERIDLNKHVDKSNIVLGFFINADISREADGFYFDDLRIVNYTSQDMVNASDIQNSLVDIFPNPAIDLLNVHFKHINSESVQIQLLTTQGVELKSVNSQDTDMVQIATDDLTSGVYICQIRLGDQLINRKVFITN